MKLKITGDGTLKGTIVVDEHGSELEHVEYLDYSQYAGSPGVVRLKVSDVFLNVHPAKNFIPGNPKALLGSQPTFNLMIIGDGSATGTYIVNSDTEDHLPDVSYMLWGYDHDIGGIAMTFEVMNVILDIKPGKPAVSQGQTPAPTPTQAPASAPSMSPGYNPYNPYAPYSTCGPSSSAPPSSPPPDAGMPPDMMSCAATSCSHDWERYVGFIEVKMVCKKCNAERKP